MESVLFFELDHFSNVDQYVLIDELVITAIRDLTVTLKMNLVDFRKETV